MKIAGTILIVIGWIGAMGSISTQFSPGDLTSYLRIFRIAAMSVALLVLGIFLFRHKPKGPLR